MPLKVVFCMFAVGRLCVRSVHLAALFEPVVAWIMYGKVLYNLYELMRLVLVPIGYLDEAEVKARQLELARWCRARLLQCLLWSIRLSGAAFIKWAQWASTRLVDLFCAP